MIRGKWIQRRHARNIIHSEPVTSTENTDQSDRDQKRVPSSPVRNFRVCLQVVSRSVITVSRANIENQHLLDRLILICEIVACEFL